MGEDISARCDAIEKCYEFMLAYAGQGLGGNEGSNSSAQVRDYLERAADAILGLADAYAAVVKRESSNAAGHYSAFLGVLERDARDSLAAIRACSSAKHDQFSANRQFECFNPSPSAAHGSFSDRRNLETAAYAGEASDCGISELLCLLLANRAGTVWPS